MILLARYLAVEDGLAVRLSRSGAYLYAADLLANTAAGSVGKWAMKHSHACAAERWRDTTDFPVLPSCFEPTPEAAEAALRRALERIQGPVPERQKRAANHRERAAARLLVFSVIRRRVAALKRRLPPEAN